MRGLTRELTYAFELLVSNVHELQTLQQSVGGNFGGGSLIGADKALVLVEFAFELLVVRL